MCNDKVKCAWHDENPTVDVLFIIIIKNYDYNIEVHSIKYVVSILRRCNMIDVVVSVLKLYTMANYLLLAPVLE